MRYILFRAGPKSRNESVEMLKKHVKKREREYNSTHTHTPPDWLDPRSGAPGL